MLILLKQVEFSSCKYYAELKQYRNVPKQVKQRMCEIMGIEDTRSHRRVPPTDDVVSGRCYECDWKKNIPSKTMSIKCKFFICLEPRL
ncbi:hypothetical protein J6590_050686 [Homalodisca vitripennis]|nr:hypothetical protein J6590_050686 [Homalodisca vitripennis]